MVRVGGKFGQAISLVERDDSFKTASRRNQIPAGVVQGGKEPKHGGFCRLIAELDVMFRGIVQASFGMGEVALVQKTFAQLAIGDRQSFFVSDNSMAVESLFERCDSLLPLLLTRFL